jgi:hypothetical protein
MLSDGNNKFLGQGQSLYWIARGYLLMTFWLNTPKKFENFI